MGKGKGEKEEDEEEEEDREINFKRLRIRIYDDRILNFRNKKSSIAHPTRFSCRKKNKKHGCRSSTY